MSVTLADLLVMFRGDTSELDQSMKKTEGGLKGFAGNATKLLGGAVVAGAAAAGAAIVGIGAAAFNFASDLDASQKALQAQFGITAEEAEELGGIAQNVFANNFAGSIGEAANAVGLVRQQLAGLVDESEFQTITENAFRLSDAFDVDVNEGISAAKTLMENFGVTSTEAFDLLAAGFQGGLNRSDDFLDTIGEYSVQFASGGASAQQFFGLLNSGMAGGMLGTDKAADAFKEFRVRINDGSATTADALAQIGLSADDINAKMSSGAMTAADAFNLVTGALQATTDPVTQMQAGVGLLGTQFEDLGTDLALNLDLTADWAEGVQGSIGKVDAQYNTLGAAFEGFKRQALVAMEPLGAELLKIANDLLPLLNQAFATTVPMIVSTIQGLIGVVQTVVSFIKGLFGGELTATLGDAGGRFGDLGTKVQTIMALIQSVVQKALTWLDGFWKRNGDTIMRIVGNTFDTIFEIIDLTLDTIIGIVTLFLQLLNGDFEAAGATLVSIIERLWEGIKTVFSNQFDSLRTLFTEFDWGELGRSIIDGIKDGIIRFGSGIYEALRGRIQAAVENTKSFFGIHSPSERTKKEIGRPLIQGITEGMQAEFNSLKLSFAGGLASSLQPAAGAAAPTVSNYYITVPISGKATYEDGRRMGRGILDHLRATGAA